MLDLDKMVKTGKPSILQLLYDGWKVCECEVNYPNQYYRNRLSFTTTDVMLVKSKNSNTVLAKITILGDIMNDLDYTKYVNVELCLGTQFYYSETLVEKLTEKIFNQLMMNELER